MSLPKHILVIRLSAMGDVTMTIPVLRLLNKLYPEVQLTIISRAFYKPLFAELSNVNFLEADVYGQHKGFGLLKLANEAKSMGVDAIADLHNVIRSKILFNYLKLKGIQGSTIDKGRKEKKELISAHGGPIIPLKSTFERYADVFRKLGFELDFQNHEFPPRKQLNPRLFTLIGSEPKKCIGIAPFAAYKSKMFPLEKMKELIVKLDADQRYQILLFGGGKKEIELLREWETLFPSVVNVAGGLTFEEELSLISNIDLMLAMDSGNGHLAAIAGIPVLTLWGVTHPFAGFRPFGQSDENQILADREKYPFIPTSVYGNKFPEGYENMMESISVEEVFKKMEQLL